MTTRDFMEKVSPDESDFDITSDDEDYIPSSDSDTGDEIEPSPRKREPTTSLKSRRKPVARSLCYESDSISDDEDVPLAHLIETGYESSSGDDEPLANLQRPLHKDIHDHGDQLAQALDEPFWEDIPLNQIDCAFQGEQEIPPTSLKTPLQYFKDFVTDEIIENIVEQSNLYSVQMSGRSISTSAEEITLFMGLYLRMGLIQCYSVRAFWASGTRCEKIADHMARNRFEKLASNIHFVNNLEVTDDIKVDKLWKLRPWLDALKTSLNKLPQEEQSAVDEVMIPFKGRSHVKQYMRNKPHKWGFKLWGRAGASGTLYEFEVYQGAGPKEQKGELSKTGEVVMRMSSNIPDGQNYKLFADNLFTSLPLVKRLKERQILFVGTVRMNRLPGCSLPSEKEMKKSGRGTMASSVDRSSGYVVVRSFDNRTVDLLSSYIGIEPTTSVQRFDKKQKVVINVKSPAIVSEYNKFMGGIDLHDSLTALYRYGIKSKRWYMYIFFYTLNMMVVNAWLRHRKHARTLGEPSLKLAEFQSELASQLVFITPRLGRPNLGRSPAVSNKAPVYRRSTPAAETRLDNVGHLPEYWPKRGRCKSRNCDGYTFIKCSKCATFLCLTKDKNCFARFHTVA